MSCSVSLENLRPSSTVSGPEDIEVVPFRNFRFHLPTEPIVRGRFGSVGAALLPDDLVWLLPFHEVRRPESWTILFRAGVMMGMDALMTPSMYTTAPRKSSREKLYVRSVPSTWSSSLMRAADMAMMLGRARMVSLHP